MTTALIQGLLKTGAPWGILCAVLTLAVAVLWRRYVSISDRLYDLAICQAKVETAFHETLERVKEDLEAIRRGKD